MATGMTYKESGVDIALKQRLIPLFGSIARKPRARTCSAASAASERWSV
jgi:hypothetical protein